VLIIPWRFKETRIYWAFSETTAAWSDLAVKTQALRVLLLPRTKDRRTINIEKPEKGKHWKLG